jgi:hypothetical protein
MADFAYNYYPTINLEIYSSKDWAIGFMWVLPHGQCTIDDLEEVVIAVTTQKGIEKLEELGWLK